MKAALLCLAVTLLLCSEATSARSVSRRDVVKGNSNEIVRGVCLGGWLVMEPWITPSIFEVINQQLPDFNGTYPIVDEWTFWEFGIAAEGIDLGEFIQEHWNSWIKKEHLATISKAGITHIRIPVGYWLWDIKSGEPFENGDEIFPYALDRLKTVVNEWAKEYSLKVLFDLHTAPGSQNGFDNSGRRGPVNILEGDNLMRTKMIVSKMSAWVSNNIDPSVVWGIEVLNEPNTFDPTVGGKVWDAMMKDFYPATYTLVRNESKRVPDVNVVLQTAFKGLGEFKGYMKDGYYNVWLDDHNYQAFGTFNSWALRNDGWAMHLNATCNSRAYYTSPPLPTVVGEFSLAVTDCTKWLLGIGRLPTTVTQGRPDVCDYYTRSIDRFSLDYRQFLSDFARAQMDAFEKANGWFFWTLRTEQSPDWDFLVGLREGWIPSPLGSRAPYACPN